jgi:putative colanic acid biosynthesis glycosyltransferase
MSNISVKISVITVVFNGSDCIERTVKNVLSQTYENIEYIVIDGNSTDTTISIIKKHNVDQFIVEPDKGIFDAMNKGISVATGDYVIFMNCGDVFHNKNTLSNIVKPLNKNVLPDFIYGDSIELSADMSQQFFKKSRPAYFVYYGMFAHHQAMLYKLDIIKNNNLYYDLKYPEAADYAFTAIFLKYSKRILKLDEIIPIYLLGGVSQVLYSGDLSEVIKIKRNVLKMPYFFIMITSFIQKFASWIKRKDVDFYHRIRYPNIRKK